MRNRLKKEKESRHLRRKRLPCLTFLFFLLTGISSLKAQQLTYYAAHNGAKMVINDDSLFTPWSSGLINPEFSEIDLNGDGKLDLFVFEPLDNKVLTFLYCGFGSYYFYAPDYERAFPQMQDFALLRDYNHDGKADIFTYSTLNGGFDIYENVSHDTTLAFKLVKRKLLYHANGVDINVYVPSSDIPAIVDMDNDGDLDILAFDVFQSHVEYYKNLSMEKYGKPDSLVYSLEDTDWGSFELSASDNTVMLGHKHGGSSLLVTDLDGDGDKDALIGDVGYPNLMELVNGKIRTGKPELKRDSIIAVDTFWPAKNNSAYIPYFPAGYEIDLDHDGVKDIVVTPHEQQGSVTRNMVFYYPNVGSAAKPMYRLETRNFLLDQMIDMGMQLAPTMVDVNGDTLPDLVIGGQGNGDTLYRFDKLMLFINEGSKSRSVFVLADTDFAGLKSRQIEFARPCFGDINGDGKPDMLVGDQGGNLSYYKNTGLSDNVPQMSLQSATFQNITTDGYTSPCLADMDKDGLPDLLLGNRDGNIIYYRNTGTASTPSFTKETDSLGKIRMNLYYYTYLLDSAGRISDSILQMEAPGFSAPAVGDFDRDGKLDLVSGSYHTGLRFFPDIRSHISDSAPWISKVAYDRDYGIKDSINPGWLSAPAVADINGDSIPDLIIGDYRGGAVCYMSKYDLLSVPVQKEAFDFRIYPNPAATRLFIDLNKPIRWETMDITGRCVQNGSGHEVDVSALDRGVYFVRVSLPDGSATVRKFVKE
jgi:hypothetical protein